ncbi:MAG: sugar phosphate isomerase/epimerase [Planctomycetota bacterium]|nr:sugar phosphate isomerase/epimerase [Planctomycetota bacterium]
MNFSTQANSLNRRQFCRTAAAATAALAVCPLPNIGAAEDTSKKPNWQPRYVLGSSMYGTTALAEILPEVHKTGAEYIDLWPRRHGNQREQVDELGVDRYLEMLAVAKVKTGAISRFDLGPFKLRDELAFAARLRASVVICAGNGPKNLTGAKLKEAVAEFVKKLEPQFAAAEKHGVTIGIENHADNLIDSPDSIRWLAELTAGKPLGIALSPYHLPQDPQLIAKLITDLGDRLSLIYAWEHGAGSKEKLPKEQELTQLPGRGKLDFCPIMAALVKTNFQGFTEIFMHPVPRGIPILPTTAEVTAEINRSREYLAKCSLAAANATATPAE